MPGTFDLPSCGASVKLVFWIEKWWKVNTPRRHAIFIFRNQDLGIYHVSLAGFTEGANLKDYNQHQILEYVTNERDWMVESTSDAVKTFIVIFQISQNKIIVKTKLCLLRSKHTEGSSEENQRLQTACTAHYRRMEQTLLNSSLFYIPIQHKQSTNSFGFSSVSCTDYYIITRLITRFMTNV